MTMRHILWIDELTGDCANLVGGKALGLGALLREGFPVPDGFCIVADAYRETVTSSGLDREIARLLAHVSNPGSLEEASARIRALFDTAALADTVAAEVTTGYRQLPQAESTLVAVRSSATTEDTADASFAGQQETYLGVQGVEAVARHVMRCWGSLFTPQAISYRADRGVALDEVAMCVVVQQMVAAETAGVMFTIDPVTGDPSAICIEASYGLGVAVVGGEVQPDRFAVDKVTLEIRSQAIAPKEIAYRFDHDSGEVRQVAVADSERTRPALAPEEVVEIAALGKRVERALGAPQDIELALAGPPGEREVFLLQARPETVWSQRRKPTASPQADVLERMLAAFRAPMRLR